jgi:RNA polymerase sigma-70 factor (ECF subfamily)
MSSKPLSALSINSLYGRAAEGDPAAEKELLEHLTVSFRLFAQHRIWDEHDAEEVVQDALVTITSKYRGIEFETSFSAWAYRVLNNKILDFVKKKQARRNLMDRLQDETGHDVTWQPDPELKARLIGCFRRLHEGNQRHARILNLHYQGYDTAEICRRLKITQNHLYVLLSRARAALEACLKRGDQD